MLSRMVLHGISVFRSSRRTGTCGTSSPPRPALPAAWQHSRDSLMWAPSERVLRQTRVVLAARSSPLAVPVWRKSWTAVPAPPTVTTAREASPTCMRPP